MHSRDRANSSKNNRKLLKSPYVREWEKAADATATSLLLSRCVLDTMSPGPPQINPLRAFGLQQASAGMCYQAINARPWSSHVYARTLNCRPLDLTGPAKKPCGNPRACPWCFVRLILRPMYNALTKPPVATWESFKIMIWQRTLPYPVEGQPLFCGKRSPQTWCDAAVAVQAAVPFVVPGTSSLQLTHAGVQLVPKHLQILAAIPHEDVSPPLRIDELQPVTETNLITAIALVMRFPWMDLFHTKNFLNFMALIDSFNGNKLTRINRYRPKADA